jgi:hypothetical protein
MRVIWARSCPPGKRILRTRAACAWSARYKIGAVDLMTSADVCGRPAILLAPNRKRWPDSYKFLTERAIKIGDLVILVR